jgi:D-aminopeptidase
VLAFTTADRVPRGAVRPLPRATLPDEIIAELFEAAVDATAEAVVNSLCMAVTVEGRNGNVAHALPLDRLCEIMTGYGRPARLPVAGQSSGADRAGGATERE